MSYSTWECVQYPASVSFHKTKDLIFDELIKNLGLKIIQVAVIIIFVKYLIFESFI